MDVNLDNNEREHDFSSAFKIIDWGRQCGFSIFSADTILLKHWDYTARDSSGRQFFNSRDWKITREWEEQNDSYREWTFDILPEDIAQEAFRSGQSAG